eukprot:362949-Chlamydomonas_euryale.AAC.5
MREPAVLPKLLWATGETYWVKPTGCDDCLESNRLLGDLVVQFTRLKGCTILSRCPHVPFWLKVLLMSAAVARAT